MHFFGSAEDYPVVPTLPFPPPLATVSDYRKVMDNLGIDRVVVVQPSAYGKDNRCCLKALAELGACARGVAVVDMNTSDSELQSLTDAGVRGARFHMLPGGVLPWEILEDMAARVHAFGWHIQLQLDGRDLPNFEAVLHRLPCNLVIDHTGKFLEPVQTDHPGFQSLVRLIDNGLTWVKLSAPYETSKVGPPSYSDVGVLARALVAAAPERLVWASNWPHPSAVDNPPDDEVLRDALLEWMGDGEIRKRVLVDNPSMLYGFDDHCA